MARAGKTCATPGCGKVRVPGRSWGSVCIAAYEQRRGSRIERGYDREHEGIRKELLDALRVALAAGRVTLCPRCRKPLTFAQGASALHAAHSVPLLVDPSSRADHLEHAACNIGAGAT